MSLLSLKTLQEDLHLKRNDLISILIRTDANSIGTYRFFQGQIEGIDVALNRLEELIQTYEKLED